MIFSGGMGVGLVFWGVAEPMMHFNSPPLGIGTPRWIEAAQMGMRYAFFHWGLHQWANFTLVGLAIAYVRFRHNSQGLISETFRPLLGDRVDTAGASYRYPGGGFDDIRGRHHAGPGRTADQQWPGPHRGLVWHQSQLLIMAGLGVLFILSAMTPLNQGIRYLSNVNMVLAAGLLAVC